MEVKLETLAAERPARVWTLSASPWVDWGLALVGMAFGLWLRWSGLYRQSLWVDEMSSYGLALQSLRNIAPNILAVDAHPPLYIFVVHVAHFTFGLGTIDSVRIPSLIAGTLTIGVVYALARILAGRIAAVVATLLVVISPIPVWYSREGRMYALAWLLVMLSFLCLAKFLPPTLTLPHKGGGKESTALAHKGGGKEPTVLAHKGRGKGLWLAAYPLTIGLALYADISSVMALVPQGAFIAIYLLRRRGEERRPWLAAALAYAVGWVLFLPWLVELPRQIALTHGAFTGYPATLGTAWRDLLNFTNLEPTYAYIFHLDVPLVTAALVLIAYIVAVAAVILIGRERPLFRAVTLSLALGAPAVGALLAAAGSLTVLIPRVLALTSFGLILAVGGAAEFAWGARDKRPSLSLAAGGAVMMLLLGTGAALADVEAQGYNSQDWRPIAATIAAKAEPGDALIYYPLGLEYMVNAYLPAGSPWSRDAVGIWQAPAAVAESYFKTWSAGRPHVWFVFYAATGVDAPTQDAWFLAHGYRRVSGDPAANYGLLEYVPTGQ